MNQGLLNRRYLRVKVFQALYAHSQSNNDVLIGEKHMMKSITEVVELYLYQLRLVLDLRDMALSNIEQNKLKRLPTEDDLNPNLRFVENRLLLILEENEALRRAFNKYKVSWRNESDNVKKLWKSIRSSESYLNYMNAPETNFEKDRAFLIALYRNTIVQYEALHHFLEDRSIYWLDDLSVVATQVIKTLKGLKPSTKAFHDILPPLYKDPEEDTTFVKQLFKKVILNEDDLNKRVEKYTTNWEIDRIVRLDMIMLKMALAELLYFETIPIKVTLNEYIELAKWYSTPNSKNFINGILDKVVADYKKSGEIRKIGRGLIN